MTSVGIKGRRSSVSCQPRKFWYGLTVADRPGEVNHHAKITAAKRTLNQVR
jgi:hypothetical protein